MLEEEINSNNINHLTLMEEIMKEFIFNGVGSIVSIITAFFILLRFFVNVFNKTIVDQILVPRVKKLQTGILENIAGSSLLALCLIVPTIFINLEINSSALVNILEWILLISLFLFSICTLVLFIIFGWYEIFPNTNKKVFTLRLIMINLYLFMAMTVLWTFLSREKILKNLTSNISTTLLKFILFLIAFYIIFHGYIWIGKHVNRKRLNKKYRIKDIDLKELDSLYLLYKYDEEQHILSENYNKDRLIDLPFYVYYPKEKVLLKYYEEK